jgi:hypothetical protein
VISPPPPPYIPFLTGHSKSNEASITCACYNTEFILGGCVLTQFCLKYFTVGSAWCVYNISYISHFWKQIIHSLLKSAMFGKCDSLLKLRTTQRVYFLYRCFLLDRCVQNCSVDHSVSYLLNTGVLSVWNLKLATGFPLMPRSECVDLCVQLSPHL